MCTPLDVVVNHAPNESGDSTSPAEMLYVRIPGSLAHIHIVRDAIDALAERYSLSPEDRAAIKLAVGEACNNAVFHAGNGTNGSAEDTSVDVALRIAPEALEIDVANPGEGGLPQRRSMPEAESLAESGRGLALIEAMMDSVEYLSRNGNTVVRMRKQRTPKIKSG